MSEQMDLHGWLSRISSRCLTGCIFYSDAWQPVTKHKKHCCLQVCGIVTSPSLLNTREAKVSGDGWSPWHSWWFLVLRKCLISVPKSPGSSLDPVFSLWIASRCRYVLVGRQGSNEWPASRWSGGGEFSSKEPNGVVTAAPLYRESLDVFWQASLCAASLVPMSRRRRWSQRHCKDFGVCHTNRDCCWVSGSSLIFRVSFFFFLRNYLHPLPKSKMSRNRCTQTLSGTGQLWLRLNLPSNIC